MSKQPLHIAVDIDGVLLDFIDRFIPVVHERLAVTITDESIVTHDLHLLFGIPYKDLWEVVNETLATQVFPAIPGAEAGMKAIAHHHITITTSRPEEHRERTIDNLAKYGFSYQDIHFRKYLKKFTENDGTDILIEDSLEEAIVASQFIPHVLLFLRPWNRFTLNVWNRLTPVSNWDEIVAHIRAIEQKRN
jgi:uncharacterized HAD superfamily protein